MAALVHDAPRLVIVQRFTYRGQREEYQNVYSFDPSANVWPANWKALADAVIAKCRLFLNADHEFVRAYGYEPNTAVSSWVHDYAQPGDTPLRGTFADATATLASGDVAMTLRFVAPSRSIKGKLVYIRKYWHGAYTQGVDGDSLSTNQKNAILQFGDQWNTDQIFPGFTPWSPGVHDEAPRPAEKCSGPHVLPYVTTRTLHRRGKRTKTPVGTP